MLYLWSLWSLFPLEPRHHWAHGSDHALRRMVAMVAFSKNIAVFGRMIAPPLLYTLSLALSLKENGR
jgi:hypothetical protein